LISPIDQLGNQLVNLQTLMTTTTTLGLKPPNSSTVLMASPANEPLALSTKVQSEKVQSANGFECRVTVSVPCKENLVDGDDGKEIVLHSAKQVKLCCFVLKSMCDVITIRINDSDRLFPRFFGAKVEPIHDQTVTLTRGPTTYGYESIWKGYSLHIDPKDFADARDEHLKFQSIVRTLKANVGRGYIFLTLEMTTDEKQFQKYFPKIKIPAKIIGYNDADQVIVQILDRINPHKTHKWPKQIDDGICEIAFITSQFVTLDKIGGSYDTLWSCSFPRINKYNHNEKFEGAHLYFEIKDMTSLHQITPPISTDK
jgi:hypothetical protein